VEFQAHSRGCSVRTLLMRNQIRKDTKESDN
jgi:hypothetical protein